MSWYRRIALVLSISSFIVLSLALTMNWVQGPGIQNLVGEVKSSDLFQHYGAGKFVAENRAADLYQNAKLGQWIFDHHTAKEGVTVKGFDYVYPPLVAWVSSPWTHFSYIPYALIWLGLSILLYLISTKQLLSLYSTPQSLFWLLLLLGLPSFHYTIILGQNSTLTLLIIGSAALLLYKNQDLAAGFILSFLFYKPQFLPLLVGFMFLLGRWKFVLAAVLGSLTWLLLGVLFCGVDSYQAWLRVIQNLSSGHQNQVFNLNQTLKIFVLTLLGQAEKPSLLAGLLTTFLGLSLLGLSALIVRYAPQKNPLKTWTAAHSLLLAAAVMTVASPYLMHYDLLLAAGWWVLCWREQENKGWLVPLLGALFWATSLISINTGDWNIPATAPLMLIYLSGSLSLYFHLSPSSIIKGIQTDCLRLKNKLLSA